MTDRANPPKNFHAVLPIVAGIGNALMAVPLARQLKTGAGAARVTVIARIDAMAEPFRRVREVDEVIVTKSATHSRTLRPEVFVVPFPSNRWQYAMLALASGAKRKLLHGYPVGRWSAMHFIGERLPAVRGIHDVDQNLRLLKLLNVEPDLTETPRFELNDSDRAGANELIGRTRDFIAIHAGSAKTILAEAKRWPTESYARLIEEMSREFSREIIVLEGPDEAGVADEIKSRTSAAARVIKLRGNLGISAAILQRASLYVGSDSGLAHLAAAVGTKPITIFGPADPDRVCPHRYRDLVIQPPGVSDPSFLYPWHATKPKLRAGDVHKIREIAVEQVMEKVRGVLSLPIGERVG